MTQVEGFDQKGIGDGETICAGCWDKSDHDIKADTNVPKGQPIYWQRVSYEYNEWESYCLKCAQEEAARFTCEGDEEDAD